MRIFGRSKQGEEPPAGLLLERLEALAGQVDQLLEGYVDGDSTPSTDPSLVTAIQVLQERLLVHTGEISQLHVDYERLKIAVSEGIEHEERREKRINATVRRAQKKLADSGLIDPALESEIEPLLEVDGEGSGESGLHALPDDVAEDVGSHPSSVEGVTREQLARARGLI